MFTFYTFPQGVECKAYFENWKSEKWMVYVVGPNGGGGKKRTKRVSSSSTSKCKYLLLTILFNAETSLSITIFRILLTFPLVQNDFLKKIYSLHKFTL